MRAETSFGHAVLGRPQNNTDYESSVSVMLNMNTGCRQNLNTDPLTTLAQCEMNVDGHYYQLTDTDDMVKLAQRVTVD